MSPQGIYLYCLARSDATEYLRCRDGIGVLEIGQVAAVFRMVPLEQYTGASAEPFLKNSEWVVRQAWEHEKVIEQVMEHSPVLPVRFGAVFSSRNALKQFLARREPIVAAFLDSIAGKEEWAVKVFMDRDGAEAWLLATDPDLADQRRRLADSPGVRYLQEQRLRSLVEKQLKHRSRALADEVMSELTALAVQARALAIQGTVAEMVSNRAFLLHRAGIEHFRARATGISDQLSEKGFRLEMSGPWPPFNFCPSLGDEGRNLLAESS